MTLPEHTPSTNASDIKWLKADVYGDRDRDTPGLMQRMKSVEKAIEEFKDLKLQTKAFVAGMAINILMSGAALAKLFGWI